MGVCDVPVISNVCDVAGEGAATLVSAPFEWLAQAMGNAASWLFEAVWTVFDTTTLVDVTRPEYVRVYNLIFGIGAILMLLFFLLQLITGLVKRDPTALTRAALGLARSVLGSFLVITLVGLALEITDQLSTGIIQAAGETTQTMSDKIAALVAGLGGITMASPGVGAILIIFLAGLAIASAAIVWLSLLIRKALLLVAIVLAPLAFSGSSWDAAKGWISKWAMFVLAPHFVQARPGRHLPRGRHPGGRAHLHGPDLGVRPAGGHRAHGPGGILAVHGLPVPLLRGRGLLQPDGSRTRHQDRAQPAPADTHHGIGRRAEEDTRQQRRHQWHESGTGQPVLVDRSGGCRSTSGIRWWCCGIRQRGWRIERRGCNRCCGGPGGRGGDRRERDGDRRTQGGNQAGRAGGADRRRRQPNRHHATSRTSAAERAHARAVVLRVVGCAAWQRAAASTRPTYPAEQGVSP